jgi:hypothetical protein
MGKPHNKNSAKVIELRPRDKDLLDAAHEIDMTPPQGKDMAFSHAVLCQVGLPRAKVVGREFMRQSGEAWINIQAGLLDEGNGAVMQPVPYGVMPRLALAWLATHAIRCKSREIPVGNSASEFLRLLGMETTGRRYTTLRTQMHALAACRLQLGFKGRTYNGQTVEQFDTWLPVRGMHQRSSWPGLILLSDGYFNSLLESCVPLDNRAMLALKGSALAMDTYTWLAHRLHRIDGRPVMLHWKAIRDQFAQEYTGSEADKNFKKTFLPALKKVQAVYPKARIKQVKGGILLISSPPPIPYKY